jgi:hypothetical protein
MKFWIGLIVGCVLEASAHFLLGTASYACKPQEEGCHLVDGYTTCGSDIVVPADDQKQ